MPFAHIRTIEPFLMTTSSWKSICLFNVSTAFGIQILDPFQRLR